MDFADLIRSINAIPGDFVIRFMSSHPKDATEKLFRAMAECEKCAHQMHLPVQSGNDRVLHAMNRGYTAEQYLSLVEYARGVMSSMLSSYFDGSLAQLVSFFSRHENIPAREMDEILEIMRNAKK